MQNYLSRVFFFKIVEEKNYKERFPLVLEGKTVPSFQNCTFLDFTARRGNSSDESREHPTIYNKLLGYQHVAISLLVV